MDSTIVGSFVDQLNTEVIFAEKVRDGCVYSFHYSQHDVEKFSCVYDEIIFRNENASYVSWVLRRGTAFSHVYWSFNDRLTLAVAASTEEEAKTYIEDLKQSVVVKEVVDDKVQVNFWVNGPNGPRRIYRELEVPTWAEIEQNYSRIVQEEFSRTIELIGDETAGRIIVWHGPPGAGKTYAIRAMMNELRQRAEFNYVVDPEAFFSHSPAYMFDVLLNGASGQDKIRLFVLEDTGSLLKPNASEAMGQGLSRLLNFADGMIGQGINARVLITTNEKINSLHSAVTRQGRCLSVVKYNHLTSAEANEWLQRNDVEDIKVNEPTILSDLYAIKGHYNQENRSSDFRAGMYV